jgi:hypothetical protein
MKRVLMLPLLILALACAAFPQEPPAQSVTNAFSLTLAPISLPGGKQTVVGTDSGLTFSPTTNFDLREDNILAPGQNFQGFFGGINYRLPFLQTKLQNTSPTVNGYRFQFYVTASAGIDRITGPSSTTQHYAFMAGGGVNYDLTGSGTWTMGGEVRYAKFPGLNNNTVVVAVGPAVHF